MRFLKKYWRDKGQKFEKKKKIVYFPFLIREMLLSVHASQHLLIEEERQREVTPARK